MEMFFTLTGCSLQELAVSYEDLIKADERGRWWIVGSAWSERETPSTTSLFFHFSKIFFYCDMLMILLMFC